MKETFISLSERTFILEALKKENRVDGRRVQDVRTVKISFREQYGTAEVQYGKTRYFITQLSYIDSIETLRHMTEMLTFILKIILNNY